MPLYLYLARRDKKGVRVLTVFKGPDKLHPTRVNDVKSLGLPEDFQDEISAEVHEHRMLWEPWLEVADDYKALRESLRVRGYTNVPMHLSISKRQMTPSVVSRTEKAKQSAPNLRSVPNKKVMMRRTSL